MKSRRKIVVCIGGGTGQVPVLRALRSCKGIVVHSIVCMTDSGGSSGRLRRRLNILPPGDLLQNLLALSRYGSWVSRLCTHRITKLPVKKLRGHSIGNLIVSFFLYCFPITVAMWLLHVLFCVRGRVLPVTKQRSDLFLETDTKTIEAEDIIDTTEIGRVRNIYLKPKAHVYEGALASIQKADFIILSPGDLYTTALAALRTEEVGTSVMKSAAKKVYIANLVNKQKHTPNFSIDGYLSEIQRFTDISFDTVLYNSACPDSVIYKHYFNEQTFLTDPPESVSAIGADLIQETVHEPVAGDAVERSYLRHDPKKLSAALSEVLESDRKIRCFAFDFDRTVGNLFAYDAEKKVFPVYSDAEPLVQPIARHYISIITSGDHHRQREKVLRSHLQVDDLSITKHAPGKVQCVKVLLKKYGAPIIFVDDKAQTLDAIRDRFAEDEVILYHMVRDDAAYPEQYKHNHTIVDSLKPIFDLMELNNQ